MDLLNQRKPLSIDLTGRIPHQKQANAHAHRRAVAFYRVNKLPCVRRHDLIRLREGLPPQAIAQADPEEDLAAQRECAYLREAALGRGTAWTDEHTHPTVHNTHIWISPQAEREQLHSRTPESEA